MAGSHSEATIVRAIKGVIGLEFDQGQLKVSESQIAGVKTKLKAVGKEASRFRSNMTGLASMAKLAIGAFIGSKIVKTFTSDYANMADKAAKTSQAIGISTERFTGLSYAAQLSGTDVDTVSTAMAKLSRNAVEASRGSKTQARAFRDLGVDYKGAGGALKPADDLLYSIADRISKMPDGTKKTALAMELFGKGGVKMVAMLNAGSAGIKDMEAEGKKLGYTIGSKNAKDAENFNDAMLRFKVILIGLRNQLAAQLLPHLTKILERFKAWYVQGNNADRVMRGLKAAIKAAAAAAALFAATKIVAALSMIHGAAKAAIWFFRTLGASATWARARVMLLYGAISLIPLLLQDLYVFMKGGDSAIGRIIGDPSAIKSARALILDVANAMREVWVGIKPALLELWPAVKQLLAAIWGAIKPLLPTVGKLLAFAIKTVAKAVTFVAKILAIVLPPIIKIITWIIKKLSFLGPVVAWAARIFGAVLGGALKVIAWLVGKIGKAFEWVGKAAVSVAEYLRPVWEPVLKAIVWLVDKIGIAWEWVKKKSGEAAELAKSAWSAASDYVDKVWQGMKQTYREIRDYILQISRLHGKETKAGVKVTHRLDQAYSGGSVGAGGTEKWLGEQRAEKLRRYVNLSASPMSLSSVRSMVKSGALEGTLSADNRSFITNVGGVTISISGDTKPGQVEGAVKRGIRDATQQTVRDLRR